MAATVPSGAAENIETLLIQTADPLHTRTEAITQNNTEIQTTRRL